MVDRFDVETTVAPTDVPSYTPAQEGERVELSTVEKMVIGVAIAVTIILIGILVSVSTRR
jgi:cell division protein FtsL